MNKNITTFVFFFLIGIIGIGFADELIKRQSISLPDELKGTASVIDVETLCPITLNEDGGDYDTCQMGQVDEEKVFPCPEPDANLGIVVEREVQDYGSGLYTCNYYIEGLSSPVVCVYSNMKCSALDIKLSALTLKQDNGEEVVKKLNSIRNEMSLSRFFVKIATLDPKLVKDVRSVIQTGDREPKFFFIFDFFENINRYLFMAGLLFLSLIGGISAIFFAYHEGMSKLSKTSGERVSAPDIITKGVLGLLIFIFPVKTSSDSYEYSTMGWEFIRYLADTGNQVADEISDYANYSIAKAVVNIINSSKDEVLEKTKEINEIATKVLQYCNADMTEAQTILNNSGSNASNIDNLIAYYKLQESVQFSSANSGSSKYSIEYPKYCYLVKQKTKCDILFDASDGVLKRRKLSDNELPFQDNSITESYCKSVYSQLKNPEYKKYIEYMALMKRVTDDALQSTGKGEINNGAKLSEIKEDIEYIKTVLNKDDGFLFPALNMLSDASDNQNKYGWLNTLISVAPAYFLSDLILPGYIGDDKVAKGIEEDKVEAKEKSLPQRVVNSVVANTVYIAIPPFSNIFTIIKGLMDSVADVMTSIASIFPLVATSKFLPAFKGSAIASATVNALVKSSSIILSILLTSFIAEKILMVLPLIGIIIGTTMRFVVYLINLVKLILISPFIPVWAVSLKNRDKFMGFFVKVVYIAFLTPVMMLLSIILAMFAYSIIYMVGISLPNAMISFAFASIDTMVATYFIYPIITSFLTVVVSIAGAFMAWKLSYQGADMLINLFGRPSGYSGEDGSLNRIADTISERIAGATKTGF